jgi:hypothetical protein
VNDVRDAIPSAPVDEREALRQSIEEDKAELLDAVDELKAAVQHQFRLRERIAEHPLPWLAGGLFFGLWLSTRFRPTST